MKNSPPTATKLFAIAANRLFKANLALFMINNNPYAYEEYSTPAALYVATPPFMARFRKA